jgi:hypothetical protein
MLTITLRSARTLAAGAIALRQTNEGRTLIQDRTSTIRNLGDQELESGSPALGLLVFWPSAVLPLPQTGQSIGRAT